MKSPLQELEFFKVSLLVVGHFCVDEDILSVCAEINKTPF